MGPEPAKIATASAELSLRADPRTDGYCPISDQIWKIGVVMRFPDDGDNSYRLFMSAARRLDAGHHQIERVREGLIDPPPFESPAGRQRVHQVIGDAEMAIWAIDKALHIACEISDKSEAGPKAPSILVEARPSVKALRDHYSHIDERAVGMIRRKPDVTAADAFDYPSIILDRKFTAGDVSLGIDQELTVLCVAIRDFLVAAWIDRLSTASGEVDDASN